MDARNCTHPQMCGYYSVNIDREFEESLSSLRYFKTPVFPINLNAGIDLITDTEDAYADEKMEHILQYILNHRKELVKRNDCRREAHVALIKNINFITYRGVIRKIMCSRYEHRSGWCILATKYKGNIYLCQLKKPGNREAVRNVSDTKRRLHKHGIKFEQCCLVDDPSKMPDTSDRVDECTQFFCVFKRKLVGRNFLFAGEMDGVVSDTPLDLNSPIKYNDLKFIELKVATYPFSSPKAEENFNKAKCQNAWTQSFLTGVKDVYFGFRDHKGIVRRFDHYNIDRLRRKWEDYWDPSEWFTFLNFFLELVEDELENIDCPYTVFEFNYNEKTGAISHKMHEGKTKLSLLPKWYIKAVNSD